MAQFFKLANDGWQHPRIKRKPELQLLRKPVGSVPAQKTRYGHVPRAVCGLDHKPQIPGAGPLQGGPSMTKPLERAQLRQESSQVVDHNPCLVGSRESAHFHRDVEQEVLLSRSPRCAKAGALDLQQLPIVTFELHCHPPTIGITSRKPRAGATCWQKPKCRRQSNSMGNNDYYQLSNILPRVGM